MKRVLWPRFDSKVYYFAFGANLSDAVLKRRRIKVFDTFDFVLENSALRFSQPGFYRDHGYASADAAEGEVVYGKMYLILEQDEQRMDYFEGVPFFAAHEKIFRQAEGFRFYFYRTTRIVAGLKPTREYLDYLITAYQRMPVVPEEYLASLSATEVLDQYLPLDQTGMFVKDIKRWPAALRPLLVRYERLCLKTVEFIWHRSILQWMIKT